MTTTITPQQIGHVIAGEAVVGTNVRDAHDPGRLDDVVARVAVGTVADVDEHAIRLVR